MARWTKEQLKNLRSLDASVTPSAHITLIPQSRGSLDVGYGSDIVWESRMYVKGIMGPRQVTQEELEAVRLSPEEARSWAERTQDALSTLRRLYPVLQPGIEARVREIESATRSSLPSGEEA